MPATPIADEHDPMDMRRALTRAAERRSLRQRRTRQIAALLARRPVAGGWGCSGRARRLVPENRSGLLATRGRFVGSALG